VFHSILVNFVMWWSSPLLTAVAERVLELGCFVLTCQLCVNPTCVSFWRV